MVIPHLNPAWGKKPVQSHSIACNRPANPQNWARVWRFSLLRRKKYQQEGQQRRELWKYAIQRARKSAVTKINVGILCFCNPLTHSNCVCHAYIFTVCVTYLPSQRPLLKTSVSASVSTKPPDIFTILGLYSAMFAGTEPGKPKHDFFS